MDFFIYTDEICPWGSEIGKEEFVWFYYSVMFNITAMNIYSERWTIGDAFHKVEN